MTITTRKLWARPVHEVLADGVVVGWVAAEGHDWRGTLLDGEDVGVEEEFDDVVASVLIAAGVPDEGEGEVR